MRKRLIQLLVLILPLGLIAAYKTYSEGQKAKEEIVTELVVSGLKYAHYNNNKIDDEFSKKVYKTYIERLDYTKKFLLSSDIAQLKTYETTIDDEIQNRSSEFLDLSNRLITKRIKEAEAYYKEILKDKFDFTKDEDIELDDSKSDFKESKESLKESWKKALKYQVLLELNTKIEIQEKAKEKNDTSVVQKSFDELEADARKKVAKRNKDYFHRLSQLERKDRYNILMNSVSMSFDPHTNYYPPKDKEDFDIAMSGQLEGIGATLQEKDGYIKVVHIVPGSPSYKQGELKDGDLILKVAQGDGEAVDVVDMRLDKAVRLIRGKKGTTVKLTVKKVDGDLVVIPIVRDIVVIEDSYAKSVILKSADTKKRIGYIFLPSFYVNFNASNGGRRCSDDVRKEVKKLTKEGIDGLIIDLRNNGGGSLPDVVTMAGYFIKEGPIVQVKQKTGNPQILKDTDSDIYYDGPMAVMVNSNSASASEIFAAALQDYNRAIIIGGQQTFGKGTVQRFINLDDIVNKQLEAYKPLGALKLTFQKFYRISGGSTQLHGVVPDIKLPDSYMDIEYGEKELDYHLPYDEIEVANFESTIQIKNKKNVIKKSYSRVKKNDKFKLIREQASLIKKNRENTTISLNLEEYKKTLAKRKETNKRFKEIYSDTTLVQITPLQADWQFIEKDSNKVKTAKAWHKRLSHDPYLKESLEVLEDVN
ncbi:MAG: tail-specific protease [Bacteroidetes bacterium]|nr:MAG: tail-specific protease [Bacteroidota bacterium]